MSPEAGSIASAPEDCSLSPLRTDTGTNGSQRHALLEDLRVLTRSQLSQALDATGQVVHDLERVGEGIQSALQDLGNRIGNQRNRSCQIEGSSRDMLELAATGTEEALRTLFDARLKIDELEKQVVDLCDQNGRLQQSNRNLDEELTQERANLHSLELRQEQIRRQHQEKEIRLQEGIEELESTIKNQAKDLKRASKTQQKSVAKQTELQDQITDRDSRIESLLQENSSQAQSISDLEQEIVQTRRETAQAIESFMNLEESLKTGAKAKAHLRILYEKSRDGRERMGTG